VREVESGSGPSSVAPAAAPASSCVLRAVELRKVFRSGDSDLTVLAGANLEVAAGEMVSIVGPSGAGKSTLLHLLAALDTPTSGTVYFEGRALQSLADTELAAFRNSRIGFVWQRHHLLPDFTAAENAAMPLLLRGISPADAFRAASRWLEQVGLADRAHHRAAELSGGEQQRVAIARALVAQPSVLLADEPTGDLDEANAEAIFDLMQRLHRSERLTSILATHNLALAGRCDRILRLEHGLLLPFLPSAVPTQREILSGDDHV
jgi:lipoprotein-releasing system ATP-binding protein